MIYIFTMMLVVVWITAEPTIKFRHALNKRFRSCQPKSFRNTVLKMMDCPQCSGFWIALLVGFTYPWIPFVFQFAVIVCGSLTVLGYLKNKYIDEGTF